jgi:hypothetical protein
VITLVATRHLFDCEPMPAPPNPTPVQRNRRKEGSEETKAFINALSSARAAHRRQVVVGLNGSGYDRVFLASFSQKENADTER